MGFYFDQGRDALAVWKFWHEGKPFLIGPVTGLAGIFLGPLYYYLIAPFYLIGGGNPVYPAIFLAFLSTLAVLMLFVIGRDMHSRGAGLIAATIGGLSYYIVTTSRWLSNPNPILLSSLILLYSMWKIIQGNDKRWWVVTVLMVGISLHFESASAVFYLPIFFIFTIWQLKKLSGGKIIIISALAFLATLLPQIIFNFRHENILINNFRSLLFEERAFKGLTKFIFEERMKFFWNVIFSKIYPSKEIYSILFITLSASAMFVGRERIKKGLLKLFLIFFLVPFFGYLFFQGNFGNIFDYYLSGYYLPIILFIAIGLAEIWKTKYLKFLILIFLITFMREHSVLLRNMLSNGLDGPTDIKFGSQIKAVNWVFENAQGRGSFNIDVYVPPVIPYAYDYLFLWQGTERCGTNLCGKVDQNLPLLYTLYEQDPPNPDRLEVWLARQKGIGIVEEEARFGGITVQRRTRIKN